MCRAAKDYRYSSSWELIIHQVWSWKNKNQLSKQITEICCNSLKIVKLKHFKILSIKLHIYGGSFDGKQ